MNRKLISNQPLRDDLDGLEDHDYFQDRDNRDRRVHFDDEEGEEQKDSLENSQAQDNRDNRRNRENAEEEDQQISRKTTKRYHQLQVIDEDTEHFKTKLDNLINKFRAETLSEFMAVKRSLLQEQTDTIDAETRKYTKLLETRTNELDRTREALAKKTKEVERAEVITHVVADWSGRAKIKKRNILALSKCFAAFKLNKERQDNKQKSIKMTEAISKKKMIARVFGAWKSIHVSTVEEKSKQDFDTTLNRELGELAAKYNKEIDMLNNRLNEALGSLELANQNKVDIQENLKKAFMRGVCALNFEAMSILDTKQTGEREEPLSDQQVMTQEIEKMRRGDPNLNSLLLNPVDDNRNYTEERGDTGSRGDRDNREGYTTSSPKKNIVFYQNPRLESKEMRWREAPVVGMSSHVSDKKPHKESILKQSSYVARTENKENDADENREDYHERHEPIRMSAAPGGGYGGHGHDEDEGRVIKVAHGTHGKSQHSATVGGSGMGSYAGKSVKSTEKSVTVNNNKAAQLRTQLSKTKTGK